MKFYSSNLLIVSLFIYSYLDQSVSTREESPDEGDDPIIDVEHVTTPTSLPYSERKVMNVMYECSHHMNLVRLPLENPEGLLEK